MKPQNDFKINEFISLKLENNETVIYVKDQKFIQCKRLILEILSEDVDIFDEINSIDEASELYTHHLYQKKIYRKKNEFLYPSQIQNNISPEVEFWGHCSNLQVWTENNYDTRLLHRNLAFPLLKKLSEAGDPIAVKVFKEEIAMRFESHYDSVMIFLLKNRFLEYLDKEELELIIDYNSILPLLDKYPADSRMHYLFGRLFMSIRKKDEAFNIFNKAINIFNKKSEIEKNFKAYYYIGMICHIIDDIQRANVVFDKCVELNPNSVDAWFMKGLTNFNTDSELALACFDKCVELNPNASKIWRWRKGVLSNLRRHKEARESFNRYLILEKAEYKILSDKGHEFLNQNKYDKAQEFFDKALEKMNFDQALLGKGYLSLSKGEFNEAIGFFDKIFLLNSTYRDEAWIGKGNVFLKIGKFEDALLSFEEALKYIVDVDKTWYGKGISLFQLGMYKEAIKSFNHALELNPELKDALDYKNKALKEINKISDPQEMYQNRLKTNPNDINVLYNLALYYVEQNKGKKAIECLEKTIQLNPNYLDARILLRELKTENLRDNQDIYDIIITEDVYFKLIGTTLKYINKNIPPSEYRNVMGLFGGFQRDNCVIISDIKNFVVSKNKYGDYGFSNDDYGKTAIWSEELNSMVPSKFVVGWYKGVDMHFVPEGVDNLTQVGHQCMNPLAVMIICNPLKVSAENPGIRAIRLKDITDIYDGGHVYPKFLIELSGENKNINYETILKEKFPQFF